MCPGLRFAPQTRTPQGFPFPSRGFGAGLSPARVCEQGQGDDVLRPLRWDRFPQTNRLQLPSCIFRSPALRMGKRFDSRGGIGACLSRARGLREGQAGAGAAGRCERRASHNVSAARILSLPGGFLSCLALLPARFALELSVGAPRSHPPQPKVPFLFLRFAPREHTLGGWGGGYGAGG